jgi:hypothetical protein
MTAKEATIQQPLPSSSSTNKHVSRQQDNKQGQLAVTVSYWVSESENSWGSVVSCCCEKLIAKARDSSGTHRGRGTSDTGNSYQATAVKTWLWALVCVCIIANYKIFSRAISKCLINPVINPKPVYSHISFNHDTMYTWIWSVLTIAYKELS